MRTIRLVIFLVCPPIRRWRYRCCLRRIDVLERELFPQWFPAPMPVRYIDPPVAQMTSIMRDYYKPAVSSALMGTTTASALDMVCQDMFLPVAQEHACGHLNLNTGKDSSGCYWVTVSCEGCSNVAYKKFDPSDFWSWQRRTIDSDRLLNSLKGFFADTVGEMHLSAATR